MAPLVLSNASIWRVHITAEFQELRSPLTPIGHHDLLQKQLPRRPQIRRNVKYTTGDVTWRFSLRLEAGERSILHCHGHGGITKAVANTDRSCEIYVLLIRSDAIDR
jgi:hypothetical protein